MVLLNCSTSEIIVIGSRDPFPGFRILPLRTNPRPRLFTEEEWKGLVGARRLDSLALALRYRLQVTDE